VLYILFLTFSEFGFWLQIPFQSYEYLIFWHSIFILIYIDLIEFTHLLKIIILIICNNFQQWRFLAYYLRFMQRVFVISLIAPAHLTPSRWISWGRNVTATAITSVLEFRLLKSSTPRRLWWPLLTPVSGRWELTTTAKGDTVSVAPRCGGTASAIHRPTSFVRTNQTFAGFLGIKPNKVSLKKDRIV